jgi:hypothetical protein
MKKPKKGKECTFGVRTPSFKLQLAYDKEGKGSTISTKETRTKQCKKNKGNITKKTRS